MVLDSAAPIWVAGQGSNFMGGTPSAADATKVRTTRLRFPKGSRSNWHSHTWGQLLMLEEGRGRTQVGTASFAWGPHDIFVAPSWQPVSHEAHEDAVVFSFSDRAAQKALGVWREEEETA